MTAKDKSISQSRLWPRAGAWVQRAWTGNGTERDTVSLVAKSTLAACMAWGLAVGLLDTQAPAFAPFSAVLFVQISVYQSVTQCLRYVAAVVAGVLLQGVIGFFVGPSWLAFGVVALVALSLSRWKALGSQGPQVATAAFFAFSLFALAPSGLDKLIQLVEIITVVLIGGVIGVVVNVVAWPPLRYRGAEYGLRALGQAMCGLVTDMAAASRAGEIDQTVASQWRQRGLQLGPIADQARDAVSSAHESLYYNPRRLLTRRHRHSSFSGYGAVRKSLERAAHQLISVTRTMEHAFDDEGEGEGEGTRTIDSGFIDHYGQFLTSVQEITEIFSRLDEDELDQQTRDLHRLTDEMRVCHSVLLEDAKQDAIPLADTTRPYGALLIEAERLKQEFQYTFEVLQQHVTQDLGSNY